MFTKILFSCNGCGLRDIEVEVAARLDRAPDGVASWLRAIVGPKVSATHRSLSPGCRTGCGDLKIPIEGKEFIGQAD